MAKGRREKSKSKRQKVFPVGKLPLEELEGLLKSLTIKDKRVVVGPKIGEDVAIIDFPDRYLAVKTDPITLTSKEAAWYVVNINANDIVTSGAKPHWFLITALLPEKSTDESLVKALFRQLKESCEALDIALCGGHTEITANLNQPILVGTMLGEVKKEELVTTSGAQIGDEIILTKGIAVEATSIIAREKEKILKQKYPPKFLNKAKKFLYSPGISVVKDALTAHRTARINCMHDPTEGGLATGLLEIAEASGVGLEIWEDKIEIFEETRILAVEFNIDPLGVIASGALLITCEADNSSKIQRVLRKKGIASSVIGKVVNKSKGIRLNTKTGWRNLPTFARDEIVKIYSKSTRNRSLSTDH